MVMSLQEGQTVLHLAATAGRTETVEALLDRGCDPNIQDFVSHSIFFAFLKIYDNTRSGGKRFYPHFAVVAFLLLFTVRFKFYFICTI
jgi:hypothetical protein